MNFGSPPVTALTASTANAGTLVPCSKDGARNEIPLSELLQALATVSSADPIVFASSLTVPANGTIQSASAGLTLSCGLGNLVLHSGGGAVVIDGGSFLYLGSVFLAIGQAAQGVLSVNNLGGPGGYAAVTNTPATILADTNNYSPGVGVMQRWSSDASRNVTGMVAGVASEWRHIWNVGAQNIVLINNSGSSSAGNKWLTSTGADLTLPPNKCAFAQYDATSTVWRVSLLP